MKEYLLLPDDKRAPSDGVKLDPGYDDKIGVAWKIEEAEGRDAANSFLLRQGLRAFSEADGK